MPPMEWPQIISTTRAHTGSRSGLDERSEFERDYDRLIYASPFRRLQDKAQVFPLEHNDFVRTRLTHSLEVSTLGRSLGRQVARRLERERGIVISSDDLGTIVATTCLAHDIGNPPFGHFGEDAIRRWFRTHEDVLNELAPEERSDFLNFDGNAQGLRILLFVHSLSFGNGLNLTNTTLAAFMKYIAASSELDRDKKFLSKPGYFRSEAEKVQAIRDALKLGKRRHPLAFLMEAADDIAYSVVDIEDGLKKKVMRHELLLELLHARLDGTRYQKLVTKLADGCLARHGQSVEERVNTSIQWFRINAIGEMFQAVVDTFMRHHDTILAGVFELPLIKESGEARQLWRALVDIARENVYCAREVLELELFGDRVIQDLLARFVPACLSQRRLDRRTLEGKHYALISGNIRALQEKYTDMTPYDRVQIAVDYICGMTDNFAVAMYEKLNGRMVQT